MAVDRAGCLLYDHNKKLVLLVQTRQYGKWGPPKGSIGKDEKALKCALRETKEETGLTIKNSEYAHITVQNCKLYIVSVDSDKIGNDLVPKDKEEISNIKWTTSEDTIELGKDKKVSNIYLRKMILQNTQNVEHQNHIVQEVSRP